MIKVYCNGTRIQCLRQGELNVGMAGAPIEFDFSCEWDGLDKTAVFRCDGERDMIIGADGKTTVPHEILTTPGMDVEVGVYAVKEDGTTWPAPTTYCKIGRVGEGADPSGDESYPPTPDVGEQAVAAASKALEAAAEAQAVAADIQRRADSGEFDGAPGYTPVKGEDYFDGDDYVLTEADKVEIAEIAAGLVDVPESGGSADLTGYATEEWVEKGYQPKGDYATRGEIPTKLSAFTNDAGFVTEDALENVGGKAYVQDTEPAQMEVGEFWYNPEEEADSFPTTLPNPHKLTFSGAVNAEYDGSKAVEVVIPQGGGGGGFELVASVELEENVTSVEVVLSKPCTDLIISAYRTYNGFGNKNPHFVKVDDNGTETAVGARYDIFPNNNSWAAWFPANVNETGNNRNGVVTGFYHYEKDIGVFSGFSSAHEARGHYSAAVGMTGVALTVGNFIETLKFSSAATDAYIAKGVKIFVWGC